MRVLVADKLPDASLEELRRRGFELVVRADATPESLPGQLEGVEVLVVRSTKVTAAALDAADALRLIVRAGAGTSTIDVPHASSRAVFVANCPGKNAVAVAELTIGLLLSLDRRIPAANAELSGGRWNKAEYGKAGGLQGRTLGVVGVGSIGKEVVRRAHGLGMDVIGWSRSLTREDAEALGIELADSLHDLAERSHAMSVHLPLTPDTERIIDRSVLNALPEGAMVINLSRGGVVDEKAMLDAVEGGRLRYATDVFADEPSASEDSFGAAIAAHPDVICTPHIGASTSQAQEAVAAEAVRIVREFRAHGVVPNCVNLCEPRAGWRLTVRHLNLVGVLATVLGLLRNASINVEELENIIFTGEVAACAEIQLSGEPAVEVLESMRACEEVLGLSLQKL